MTAEVLSVADYITIDQVARSIAETWQFWDNMRSQKKVDWAEVRRYKYAVDTTTTTNAQLPWKNKTTYPKLTQIADNLKANYLKSLFPRRQWLIWEGFDQSSEVKAKRDAIEQYMLSVVENSDFKQIVGALLDDWIDFGNCIGTVEWADERILQPSGMKVGYVGPKATRISPFDIVFNPIASTFTNTPKIVRKFVTLGDLKEEIQSLSGSGPETEELYKYLLDLRNPGHSVMTTDTSAFDQFLAVDGFTDFKQYLGSDYAEVLTFYGDLFIRETGQFFKNHIITIVDRHRIISNVENPSVFGRAPIYHSPWRARQDNLWGMGPLDNLVGMQYRVDHLENLKADVFDLNAFPPLKIKGLLNADFEWGPMERIYIGDDGDVEMVAPHFEILNANNEIDVLERRMEEIAGAPKEAMGIRSPGEKTKYEVQRLENASGRIFQARLDQFEDQIVEPLLTAMLELARRKLVSTELRVFNNDLKFADFQSITANDIMGNGRLRPVAAKHFAEQADRVQNLTAFADSGIGKDPMVNIHISGLGLAKIFEELLEIQQYKIVQPFIRVSEQHEAQNLTNASQESSMTQLQTPSGLHPGDTNPQVTGPPPPGMGPQGPPGGASVGPQMGPAQGLMPPGVAPLAMGGKPK